MDLQRRPRVLLGSAQARARRQAAHRRERPLGEYNSVSDANSEDAIRVRCVSSKESRMTATVESTQTIDVHNAVIEYVYESGILARDRKSTRLNSSHVKISYAVFCLKKKTR